MERKSREPFHLRSSNLHKNSLGLLDVPAEQVHPHNAQPPKTVKVMVEQEAPENPVFEAKILRELVRERCLYLSLFRYSRLHPTTLPEQTLLAFSPHRDIRTSKEIESFEKRTKARSNLNPDASKDAIDKLKQKFRVRLFFLSSLTSISDYCDLPNHC